MNKKRPQQNKRNNEMNEDSRMDDKDLNPETQNEETEVTPESEEMGGGEIGVLKKQVENLQTLLKDKSEEVLRKAADLDNYRKRLQKEFDDKIKYANQSVMTDVIPVLDNIELSLSHAAEGTPLYEGLKLTIKMFKDMLARHGVKEIEAEIGTKFDPALHDAMMMDNNPEYENNTITMNVQRGYKLNERVIRPAKVKVNKL